PCRLECSQGYGIDRPRVQGSSACLVPVRNSVSPAGHWRQVRCLALAVEKLFWIFRSCLTPESASLHDALLAIRDRNQAHTKVRRRRHRPGSQGDSIQALETSRFHSRQNRFRECRRMRGRSGARASFEEGYFTFTDAKHREVSRRIEQTSKANQNAPPFSLRVLLDVPVDLKGGKDAMDVAGQQ